MQANVNTLDSKHLSIVNQEKEKKISAQHFRAFTIEFPNARFPFMS